MEETTIESLTSRIVLSTPGRGFTEISDELRESLRSSGVQSGLLHVFLRHTSASLLLTENADPDVRHDLESFISRLAPDGDPAYIHRAEGPDDMPAHIRSVLTSSELSLPVRDGRLALGTWQGVYLWEHRHRPHRRSLDITIIGK
ncbi:secondary thiamine-phosphate synthase enzyme YjbQ [Pseudomonadota bacterium]